MCALRGRRATRGNRRQSRTVADRKARLKRVGGGGGREGEN